MKKMIIALVVFTILFSVCYAEAAEFIGTKMGLPTLVMLSTPT